MRAALVIPSSFDAGCEHHRAERQLACEMLAVLHPRCEIEVVSEPESLEGYAFALCILDRALATRCAAHVPTRLVGSDTLYFNHDKWRLCFFHPGWDVTLAAGREAGRGVEPAVVYVDQYLAHDDATRLGEKIRERQPGAVVYVSRYLASPTRAALEAGLRQPAIELESQQPLGEQDHLISTDLATLQLVRGPRRKTFISTVLGFHDATSLPVPRSDLLLYKGEEADHVRLLTLLLTSGDAERPARREYQRPLISVVVPIYDRKDEIRRLSESICAQDYPNLEVIFVTNGSPPETLAAVREATVRLLQRGIHVQTLSFATAFGSATIPRDIGCYAARGAFLCPLDSDDYLEPGFFEYFLAHPMFDDVLYSPKRIYRNAGRVMGDDITFDRVLDGIGNVAGDLYPLLLTLGNVFQNSGVIISRDAFVRAGGIDHSLRYCEDYYLWLRLARGGASAIEHAGRVSITFHPGNNELNVAAPEWFFLARAAAEREHVF